MLGILVLLSFMPILYTAMLGSTFPPRAPSPTHFSLSLSLSPPPRPRFSLFTEREAEGPLCWLAGERAVSPPWPWGKNKAKRNGQRKRGISNLGHQAGRGDSGGCHSRPLDFHPYSSPPFQKLLIAEGCSFHGNFSRPFG